MKTVVKWLLLALLAGAVTVVATRAMQQRQAQQAASNQAAAPAESVIDLVPSDLVQVQRQTLAQVLPVSGSLKATRSAFIKARVAGELQGLTLREGDVVKAGQVVARVDDTDTRARLRQAQQQAQAAKAQVDIARRTHDNNAALVQQGFISRWALDSSSASLASAQANHEAAAAGVDMIAQLLQDTVLRAPIGGMVAQRLAQNGERIAVEGRVLEIVDISQLELEAAVAAEDSPGIRVGQTAELQIEGTAAPVLARVVRINPTVVPGSRSVLVYLALAPTPGLRQGLFAQGTLTLSRLDTPALPLSAVRTDKPRPYVQRVQDGKVVHQTLEPGARGLVQGHWMVAVDSTLPEASTVVAGSVGPLREGSRVRLSGARQ